MNNSNKYEITITSRDNGTKLNEQPLRNFFAELSSSIKRCKILPNKMKAFITFKNIEAYHKALAYQSGRLQILPSHIDLITIYENIQLLKKNMNNRLNILEHKMESIYDRTIVVEKDTKDSINYLHHIYLHHDLYDNNISIKEQEAYQQQSNTVFNNDLPEQNSLQEALNEFKNTTETLLSIVQSNKLNNQNNNNQQHNQNNHNNDQINN